MEAICEAIQAIQARIEAAARRAGRNPEDIRLVAVSKRMAWPRLLAAASCGQLLFGENYVQEAATKIPRPPASALEARMQYHLIGHLQSNKAGLAAQLFDCIETIDRLKLARALDSQLARLGKVMPVLIQVNIGGEGQKSGVLCGDARRLAEEIATLPRLRLRGLMTIPPYADDPELTRPFFRQMRQLLEELAGLGLFAGDQPPELSMGMSADFEAAVEEGATLVRVGTAIFGERS